MRTGISYRGSAIVLAAALLTGACGGDSTVDHTANLGLESEAATAPAEATKPAPVDVPDASASAGSATAGSASTGSVVSGAARTDDDQIVPVAPPALVDGITDEGVLAAAIIILSDGDLESAITEGIVSEQDAEAALQSIEDGTLNQFAD
jgi:hypothetical protein